MTARSLYAAALALVAVAASALPAAAHVAGAGGGGFAAGFGHPLGGLDHLLAMVAVGLWAAQQGGRSLWLQPAAFVGAMAVGGLAGMTVLGAAPVELAIVGSVVVLGAAVALGGRVAGLAAAAGVALFGLVHGHAHGVEMAAGASALAYGLGVLIATALLHAAGLAAALGLSRIDLGAVTRVGGGAIAATGVLLLVA